MIFRDVIVYDRILIRKRPLQIIHRYQKYSYILQVLKLRLKETESLFKIYPLKDYICIYDFNMILSIIYMIVFFVDTQFIKEN